MTWIQATDSAGWSGRWSHASIVFDNKMWVFGGVGGYPSYPHYNDVWYSTDGITWTQATANAQWSARHWHTSVIFDNKIWVLGGWVPGISGPTNDVWYSTDGVTWTQATANAGWSTRCLHASVMFDNKMWVFGGQDASFNSKNDVWYSTDGVTWTQATANAGWSTRFLHVSVVFDNKMWVIGGWDGICDINDVWYSTDGINWTQATDSAQWTAREGETSVAFDNKIWVFGGEDGCGWKNDVWYSTNGVSWIQATANAEWLARRAHTSVVYDDKIWVIGGYRGNDVNDVWYSTGLGIEENHQPLDANRFSLNAEPNPFKTHTVIRYSLSAKGNISLSIFDISGKLAINLVNEFQSPGVYNIVWNGKDENNRAVSHGIYFAKIQGKDFSEITKIIVVE